MKKLAMIIAATITVLTLLTLVLDLPEKLKVAYAAITGTAPPIRVEALFAHQETITVAPMTENVDRGFMRFTWPSVYEVHNVTDKDIAIADLMNVLPAVRVGDHSLQLQAEGDADRVVTVYDSLEDLNSKEPAGTTERLPLTIRAGDKKYIKVYGKYTLEDRGSIVFCKDKQQCHQILGKALGVAPKKDGSVPCVLKSFQARMDFIGYKHSLSPQKAVLLIPGCKMNLQPLLDQLKAE